MGEAVERLQNNGETTGTIVSGQLCDTLLSVEQQNTTIGHVLGFLHHGEVDSNKDQITNSSKDINEPLNMKGIQQIREQAQCRKKIGISKENLTIHLPPGVVRDRETARVFCQELGIEFPENVFFAKINKCFKQLMVLDVLQKYMTNKLDKKDIEIILFKQAIETHEKDMRGIFDETIKIISPSLSFFSMDDLLSHSEYAITIQENILRLQNQSTTMAKAYPYLVCDDALLTTKKGKKVEGRVVYPGNVSAFSSEGSESAINARMRAATHVYQTIEKIKNTKTESNDVSADIFVGHRTGVEGFLDIKYNRKNLEYNFTNPEGDISLMFLDPKGQVLDQTVPRYFEFDASNYDQQLEELAKIEDIGVSKEHSLIKNQDIVNTYLQKKLLSKLLVVKTNDNKTSWEMRRENIKSFLYSDHDILRNYTFYALLDNVDKIDAVQVKEIFLQFLENFLGTESEYNETQKINMFKEIYRKGKESIINQKSHHLYDELWRLALHHLYQQDSLVITKLGEYRKNADIQKECVSLEYAYLGEQIGSAYSKYRKSGRRGKKGYRDLGQKEERTKFKTSPENFLMFVSDIFKMDAITAKKAAIGRLRMLLEETGLDTYFYTKSNGLASFLGHSNGWGLNLPIPKRKRDEILLQMKILGYKNINDLDMIISLLLPSGQEEHIHEILKTLGKKANKEINNVVDLIFIGSAKIEHLIGSHARKDLEGFVISHGMETARGQKIWLNNNSLMNLGKILRGPIKNQVRVSIEEQLNVSNGLDCLDLGGDNIKAMIGGPRKLGVLWNLALYGHAIYGEGDQFAHARFTSKHILQLSEKMWGDNKEQFKKTLSEKNIDAQKLKTMTPGEFYSELAPHTAFAIGKFISHILGRKISKITEMDLQELSIVLYTEPL